MLDKHTAPRLVAEFHRLDKLHAREDEERKHYPRRQWQRIWSLIRASNIASDPLAYGLDGKTSAELRTAAFAIHARLARFAEAMTTDYSKNLSQLNEFTGTSLLELNCQRCAR